MMSVELRNEGEDGFKFYLALSPDYFLFWYSSPPSLTLSPRAGEKRFLTPQWGRPGGGSELLPFQLITIAIPEFLHFRSNHEMTIRLLNI